MFQAGVRRNTLAWNNRIGPCILIEFFLIVGFKDTEMVNRDSVFLLSGEALVFNFQR